MFRDVVIPDTEQVGSMPIRPVPPVQQASTGSTIMSRSLRVAVDGLMSRPDRLQAQFPTVGGALLVGLRADSPMLIPAGSDDHSFLSGSRVCGKRRVPKGSSRGHGPPPGRQASLTLWPSGRP